MAHKPVNRKARLALSEMRVGTTSYRRDGSKVAPLSWAERVMHERQNLALRKERVRRLRLGLANP